MNDYDLLIQFIEYSSRGILLDSTDFDTRSLSGGRHNYYLLHY